VPTTARDARENAFQTVLTEHGNQPPADGRETPEQMHQGRVTMN